MYRFRLCLAIGISTFNSLYTSVCCNEDIASWCSDYLLLRILLVDFFSEEPYCVTLEGLLLCLCNLLRIDVFWIMGVGSSASTRILSTLSSLHISCWLFPWETWVSSRATFFASKSLASLSSFGSKVSADVASFLTPFIFSNHFFWLVWCEIAVIALWLLKYLTIYIVYSVLN